MHTETFILSNNSTAVRVNINNMKCIVKHTNITRLYCVLTLLFITRLSKMGTNVQFHLPAESSPTRNIDGQRLEKEVFSALWALQKYKIILVVQSISDSILRSQCHYVNCVNYVEITPKSSTSMRW